MTGGNRGIGLAVVEKLLRCEMTVIMGVRNPDKCKEIVEKLFHQPTLKGRVIFEKCDTGDMSSVREFAQKVRKEFKSIHVLINNGKF